MVGELLVVAMVTWMWAAPRSLKTRTAAHGIVSLALARTPSRARQIRDHWAQLDRLGTARRTLAYDIGLIALYSASLWIGSLLAARLAESTGFKDAAEAADAMSAAVYAVALAALFDLLKIGGCLLMLKGRTPPWVTAATWNFAVVKFALLATAGFGVVGLVVRAIVYEVF